MFCFFLWACPEKEQSTKNMTGAWSETEVNNEIKMALNALSATLELKAPVDRVLSARSQVVNGMNYELEVQLENAELWIVWIHRDLNGNYTVLRPAKRKD
jgi:hypothetical protein